MGSLPVGKEGPDGFLKEQENEGSGREWERWKGKRLLPQKARYWLGRADRRNGRKHTHAHVRTQSVEMRIYQRLWELFGFRFCSTTFLICLQLICVCLYKKSHSDRH